MIDYQDDDKFNDYIYKNYHFREVGFKSTEEVEELCALILKRRKKINGNTIDKSETYISTANHTVTWDTKNNCIIGIQPNKKYRVDRGEARDQDGNLIEGSYSIYIDQMD